MLSRNQKQVLVAAKYGCAVIAGLSALVVIANGLAGILDAMQTVLCLGVGAISLGISYIARVALRAWPLDL